MGNYGDYIGLKGLRIKALDHGLEFWVYEFEFLPSVCSSRSYLWYTTKHHGVKSTAWVLQAEGLMRRSKQCRTKAGAKVHGNNV